MTHNLKMYHQSLFIFMSLLQTTLNFGGILSYDNKDSSKAKIDPSCVHLSNGLIFNNKMGPRSLSAPRDDINVNNSPIKSTHLNKKLSRNQYGIINMLWSFPLNRVRSTSNYYSDHSLLRLPSRPKSIASTSNFIEFYYIDKTDAPFKKIIQNHQQLNDERSLQFRGRYRRNMRREAGDHPMLAFLINDPNYKRLPKDSIDDLIIQKSQTPRLSLENYLKLQYLNYSTLLKTIKHENSTVNRKSLSNERPTTARNTVTFKQGTSDETKTSNWPNLTTVYDKIKFFELYDNNTPFPNEVESRDENMENVSSSNNVNTDPKLMLVNVDESLQHKNSTPPTSNLKKNYKRDRKDLNSEKSTLRPVRFFDISTKKNTVTNRPLIVTNLDDDNKNIVATWSQFSFMAAYIYEPTQVLCDAAAISPHWLVTSGSCLSKSHKDLGREGRSAYVAYCDGSWWNAERLAYVNQSIVHPRYSEKHIHRRNMYNIGLIQVVITMATCTSWAPVALISQKSIIPPAGSKAYAVGWGLERYNTGNMAAEAAKRPLMVYESKLFQDSCSNQLTFGEINNNVDEDMQNLYCLSSPPFKSKEFAPVYGSMLLIEGKLCGIYLQEQHQYVQYSSILRLQYSSIWRLGPWVSKVAREPDY